MIRLLYSISLFITLFSSSLLAQTIGEINIEGSNRFGTSEYTDWIGIEEGTQYNRAISDSVKKRISLNLTANGYYDFEIDITTGAVTDTSLAINISVDEGQPTYVEAVNITGIAGADSAEVSGYFAFAEDEVFTSGIIEEGIVRTLDYLENIGYPFAEVIISSLEFYTEEEHLVDVSVRINKQKSSLINQVEIEGNTKTKDYVILRNIRLEKGEPYSQERIEEIPKQLNRLGFFKPVPTPEFYYNAESEGVLKITIEEKETNSFDGIIGYVPGGENEDGYFTGFVNISLRNLFGTERSAAFKWHQETSNTQELEIKYIEPWVFGYPFTVGGGLFQRKQDTTYVQRTLNADVSFVATETITASLLLESETVIPTESEERGFTVYNSSSLVSGIALRVDSRDDPLSPTEGIFFSNAYKYSSKKINGPDEYVTPGTETDINLQRLELDFGMYYQIAFGHVAAASIHARELKGTFFEVSDLYELGGTTTLRGYRERQFLGNRLFWSNLEYRYLLSSRSFLFLFLDTGYYLRDEDKERNVRRTESFKYGYGLGMNIETGLGLLNVSFALGEGDSFSEGKIHFGLLNEF